MTPRYDIAGEIGEGNARAEALSAFLAQHAGQPVHVVINSPGGIASEGSALLATMERHGNVTVHIEGMAASAASLAALGGRTVLMHTDALLMIHEPSAFTWGTASEHRAGADMLDKMTGVYAAAYARATGQPVELVAAWMAEETWMTAQEALELNFCDGIEGEASKGRPVAAFDYGRFRNAPRELVALAMAKGWAGKSGRNEKGNEDA
jgi:ATP-dependent protease ClpP protease subunit